MNIDGGIQLGDISGILRRRSKVAGVLALGVFLIAYWVGMALPNIYTSYATVLVEPQAVAPKLVEAGVTESDLNARLHLMTAQILSRPRLSRIIDDLGLYEGESDYMLREEVIDLMRERVRVEPVIPDLQVGLGGRRSDVEISEFRILFSDYDSIQARDVAQRLANDFIETHIQARVQVSQKSLDFVDGELQRLAGAISKIEADIARVKNESPGSLPEELDASQRQLERVLMELTQAQRSLAEAASDEAFYRSQMAAHQAAGTGDATSPARHLELLKLQLGEYLSKGFTDKHPDVRKTREEIARIEASLRSDDASGSSSVALAPLAQQAEAEARRAVLRRTAAEEEIARLEARAQAIQERIMGTPAVAERLDALNREYEHLFNTFQDFSTRKNEAEVQAQLERRQLGEQFRVLESAFEAPEPSAPNRLLIIALGAVFAVMVGVGAAVLLEATDTSAHDAHQLQTRVQLPVLASIPQIWLESDLRRQRRRRIRTGLATAGVVMFALVGGAANYVWVNGMPRSFTAPTASEEAAERRGGAGG